MKKTLALFGSTGGLGKKLLPKLQEEYNVIPISSSDIDITDFGAVKKFFLDNDIDIVVNLSGKKYDTFLGKI